MSTHTSHKHTLASLLHRWGDDEEEEKKEEEEQEKQEGRGEAGAGGGAREAKRQVMCHKQGLRVARVESEKMIKLVASPACLTTTATTSNTTTGTTATTSHLHLHNLLSREMLRAGLTSLTSLFDLNLV